MRRSRALLAAVACVVFVGSASLAQGNNLLHGDYGFSAQLNCAVSTAGFDPDTFEPLGPVSHDIVTVDGVRRYNGDGTGSVHFRSLRTRTDQVAVGQFPVTVAEAACPLTYSVAPDRTFVQELGTCTGEVIVGQLPGLTFEVMGIRSAGLIERGGQSLLFTETNPNIEITTTIFGASSAICGRSGTAIRK